MTLSKLVAVALLTPAVALAAPPKSGKSTSSTSSSRPAAASSAKTSATSGSQVEGLEVGGFVGYETDDLSGLSLRLDGELPFRELSPQVKLSLVGSFGYSYLSDEQFGVDISAHVIKLVPAARFTIPLNEQFSVFGDAGLGLAYVRAKVEVDPGFGQPRVSDSDSTINIMMRLGAGAFYQVNPQLRVGAMLEFDPIFGDFGYSANGVGDSQSTFLIQVGGMFKL